MPQLLLLMVAGAGIWVAYRWFRKESARVADTLKRAEEELKRAERTREAEEQVPTLEYDEKTDTYRPVER